MAKSSLSDDDDEELHNTVNRQESRDNFRGALRRIQRSAHLAQDGPNSQSNRSSYSMRPSLRTQQNPLRRGINSIISFLMRPSLRSHQNPLRRVINSITSFLMRPSLRPQQNSLRRVINSITSFLMRPSLRSQHNPLRRGINSIIQNWRYWCFGLLVIVCTIPLIMMKSVSEKSSSTVTEGAYIGLSSENGSLIVAPHQILINFELNQRFADNGHELQTLRRQPRLAVHPPLLAIVLSRMDCDVSSLMLITLGRNLQLLGYKLQVYAFVIGKTLRAWDKIGCPVSVIDNETLHSIDWSNFVGVLLTSLEDKIVVSSLMQEPFLSVPLIWIVQEDTLGQRLPLYEKNRWAGLVSEWISAFSRANVVVFPDFTLPMMYSKLDTGNFYVIPGLPVEAWDSEARDLGDVNQLREDNRLKKDDLIVFVTGNPFANNGSSLEYEGAIHSIVSFLVDKYISFKFFFFRGNASDGGLEAMKNITSWLGLPADSMRFYGENDNVDNVLSMADIVLYGSSQEEEVLPPLFLRAMGFGKLVMAPDLPFLRRYIQNDVNGLIYPTNDAGSLTAIFSKLFTRGKLNRRAYLLGSTARLRVRYMIVLDFITSYVKLLENVVQFPSDARLPKPVLRLHAPDVEWAWKLIGDEMNVGDYQILGEGVRKLNILHRNSSWIFAIEERWKSSMRAFDNEAKNFTKDIPTQQDWDDARNMEISEEYERREMEELNGRMESGVESWDDVHRNARKCEKANFESNERDEGQLERTGLPLCIYEIYDGAGAWPFLHRGSLYRGLSLSAGSRRTNSDDLDAVERLPLVNNSYYRGVFCEFGGLFSIANVIDNIHKHPWIGFQSWRVSGRKVCSVTAFAEAFRLMYALPSNMATLPPMPRDGDQWSTLHSWAMPTRSFLEFVMFSRMFTSSLLDSQRLNPENYSRCLLGSSKIEKRQCYCRILEVLVNVWAYHSARKMVYIDPISGLLEEQHPIQKRIGSMWVTHFNSTLLKEMDEDWAEEAGDDDHPLSSSRGSMWLWPLTGEVYCNLIFDKEHAEKERARMEKSSRDKEKLLKRQKHGYKQRPLGG
ncbi:hypothetical protein AMTRI_Chr09g34260 [Amborella trichopoda]